MAKNPSKATQLRAKVAYLAKNKGGGKGMSKAQTKGC